MVFIMNVLLLTYIDIYGRSGVYGVFLASRLVGMTITRHVEKSSAAAAA